MQEDQRNMIEIGGALLHVKMETRGGRKSEIVKRVMRTRKDGNGEWKVENGI